MTKTPIKQSLTIGSGEALPQALLAGTELFYISDDNSAGVRRVFEVSVSFSCGRAELTWTPEIRVFESGGRALDCRECGSRTDGTVVSAAQLFTSLAAAKRGREGLKAAKIQSQIVALQRELASLKVKPVAAEPQPNDHLADAAHDNDIVAVMRERAPGFAKGWTPMQIKKALAEHDVTLATDFIRERLNVISGKLGTQVVAGKQGRWIHL